jgi:membrane associated rhomboid family serine protease
MIPIRDTVPRKTVPVVTWSLIAINVAVFVWELSLGPALGGEIARLSFQPARFFGAGPQADLDAVSRLLPLITSQFLHGGWLHLAGNMIFLAIFGDNVEDALGHILFVLFYLFCGAAACLTQGFSQPASTVPMVGASGAIAGVLGAFFLLFPTARVLTLFILFVFFPVVEIPAFFFLLYWFLLQFVSGARLFGLAGAAADGVAWWAHVGGFAAGLSVALVVRIARAFR